MIDMRTLVGDEWAEWYLLTPAQRLKKSSNLWRTYLELGGSLDPEADPQSPFSDPAEWHAVAADGRPGVRVVRRSRIEPRHRHHGGGGCRQSGPAAGGDRRTPGRGDRRPYGPKRTPNERPTAANGRRSSENSSNSETLVEGQGASHVAGTITPSCSLCDGVQRFSFSLIRRCH